MAAVADVAARAPQPRPPWSWLADPRGIGWPLTVLLTLLVVIDVRIAFGQIGSTAGSGQDRRVTAAVAAVCVVVFLVVLVVARWGWLSTALARRRPSLMLGTLLIAVFVAVPVAAGAGPTVAVLLVGAGADGVVPGPVVAVGEVAGRGVLLVIWTALLLVVLGALNAYRDALASLRAARVTLEATLEASTAELSDERSRLRERVRALVEGELGPRLDWLGDEAGPELRRIAETVVRPLSHRVALAAPGFGPVVAPPAVREPWRRALGGLVLEPRVWPLGLGLTLTLLAFARSFGGPAPGPEASGPDGTTSSGAMPAPPGAGPGLRVAVDWGSLGVSLVLLALTFVTTFLASRLIHRWLAARSDIAPGRRWAASTVSLGALGVGVAVLAATVHRGLGLVVADLGRLPPIDLVVVAANVLPLWLATLVGSLAASAREALARHRSELAEHNTDLGRTVVRTNTLLARERQEFARALHGSVQAAIHAAGIRLDRAAREGLLDAEMRSASIEPIRRALESLDPARERAAPDLALELERTRATWDGVCDVTVELDPDIRVRLDADVLAASVALDLVREACANAVVHGSASRVSVALLPEGEREVLLRVRDDGTSTHPLRASGLGSRVLDTTCTRWHLARGESGTELEAVLPLG
ncbi:MAG: hypothetical protein RLZZ272_915 [Actinomycetota bacterium]